MQLTDEQSRAVKDRTPLRLIDPDTNTEYVLVRSDLYEQLASFLSGETDFNPEEAYPLIDEVMREDWDDPKMAEYDEYDDYEAHRRSSSRASTWQPFARIGSPDRSDTCPTL